LLGKRRLRQRPAEKRYNILSILTIFVIFDTFSYCLQQMCISAREKAPAAAPAGEEMEYIII